MARRRPTSHGPNTGRCTAHGGLSFPSPGRQKTGTWPGRQLCGMCKLREIEVELRKRRVGCAHRSMTTYRYHVTAYSKPACSVTDRLTIATLIYWKRLVNCLLIMRTTASYDSTAAPQQGTRPSERQDELEPPLLQSRHIASPPPAIQGTSQPTLPSPLQQASSSSAYNQPSSPPFTPAQRSTDILGRLYTANHVHRAGPGAQALRISWNDLHQGCSLCLLADDATLSAASWTSFTANMRVV